MLTTFPMSSSRSRSSSSSRHSLGVLVFVGIFSDNNGTATVAVPCLPAARQKNTNQKNQQQQIKLHNCTINRAKKYRAWLLNKEISFKKNYFINKIIFTCYSLQINFIKKGTSCSMWGLQTKKHLLKSVWKSSLLSQQYTSLRWFTSIIWQFLMLILSIAHMPATICICTSWLASSSTLHAT